MTGFVRKLVRAEDVLFRIEKTVEIILIVVMTLVTTAQMISRYIFGVSLLVGIDELINWTFVWMVFIGMGMLVRQGGHIGLEVIYNSMPGLLQKIRILIVNLGMIAMAVILIKNSIPFLKSQMAITTTSANIPKAYLYAAIPVGMALLAFHLIVQIGKTCFGAGDTQKDQ